MAASVRLPYIEALRSGLAWFAMKNSKLFPRILARAGQAGLAFGIATFLALPASAQQQPTRPSESTGAADTTTRTQSSSTMELSDDTKDFVKKAAKSGMKEVRLSRLAVERTTNTGVREFAQTLINDHQSANAELASLANQRGMMIPLETAAASMRMDEETSSTSATPGSMGSTSGSSTTTTTTSQSEEMEEMHNEMEEEISEAEEELSELTGSEFDQAYVEMMIEDHEEAIDLFEDQANQDEDPELASFAQQKVAVLRRHLMQAEALQEQLEQ